MKPNIELTLAAGRHAKRRGLLPSIHDVALPENLVNGDIVKFSTATGPEAFVVLRRHLHIMADGTQSLVIELDYPIRG